MTQLRLLRKVEFVVGTIVVINVVQILSAQSFVGKMGTESLVSSAFDKVLRNDIKKYIGKIKNLENGARLHPMVVSMVERSLIEVTMEETCGNQSEAAHILGVNRNTLRRKLKEFKIKPGSFDKPAKKNGRK